MERGLDDMKEYVLWELQGLECLPELCDSHVEYVECSKTPQTPEACNQWSMVERLTRIWGILAKFFRRLTRRCARWT
jgi:hypothetical protein